MQKKLIVAALAAIAAAPAFAQSNVTVYGVFDAGYTQRDTKNSFTQSTNVVGTSSATKKESDTGLDGTLSGGRIGFRGTEDLGNGLKANFTLEYGTNWTENTGIGATRLGWAGLSGGFGELRVGRIQSPVKMVLDSFNPNENSTNFVPGNLDAHLGLTDVRISNAVTYITPSFSGFNARLQFANVKSDSDAAAATGETKDQYANFGLNYENGPLAVAYARNAQKTATEAATGVLCASNAGGALSSKSSCGTNETQIGAATTTTSTKGENTAQVLAVKYNFGVAVPFYSRTEREVENASGVKTVDSSVDTIGVTVPVDKFKFVAQYADGKSKAANGNPQVDHKAWQLLGVYSLSKRTNVYAIYGDTESKNATNKYELDGFALGLRHTF